MSLRGRVSMIGAVAVLAAACTGGGGAATLAPATQAPRASRPVRGPGHGARDRGPGDGRAPRRRGLLGQIIEAGTIRISTDANYEPFSFLNPDTNYEGFDTDVRRDRQAAQRHRIEWEPPNWALITAGSWGGRWDTSSAR